MESNFMPSTKESTEKLGLLNDPYHKLSERVKSYFEYGFVDRWIDGDTFEATVDLGFRISIVERFRLFNYNAPECKGHTSNMGKKALQHVKSLIPEGYKVLLQTYKDDVFGRWLADVYYGEDFSDSLVDVLISEGWGVHWDGKGKSPEPWYSWPEYPMVTVKTG